jgi:SAM-dependent methyltransferase
MLPSRGEDELISGAISPESLVLDLGAGTGRIADALAALGHVVVAVDNSPDMLAAIRWAEPVLANIETYRDRRRFDAVVLASHLINTPDEALRQALLETVAYHLRDDSTAFIEWHPPEWFDRLSPGGSYSGTVGAIESTLSVIAIEAGLLHAKVTYAVNGDDWTQSFTAQRLTSVEMEDALSRAGLTLISDLPFRGDWVLGTSRAG